MRLLEGQVLLKFQSLVDTCSTMELELDLEVSPIYWKETPKHLLQLPQKIEHIQRPIPWLHFIAQLDVFYHQGRGRVDQSTLI